MINELNLIFEKSRETEDKINELIIKQEEIVSKISDLRIQQNLQILQIICLSKKLTNSGDLND
jgi:hypothetical protein